MRLTAGAVVFLEVAEQRLGDALFLLVVEAELDGVVAVGSCRFDLEDAVGAGEDDRDGHKDALGVIDAGLAEFFS